MSADEWIDSREIEPTHERNQSQTTPDIKFENDVKQARSIRYRADTQLPVSSLDSIIDHSTGETLPTNPPTPPGSKVVKIPEKWSVEIRDRCELEPKPDGEKKQTHTKAWPDIKSNGHPAYMLARVCDLPHVKQGWSSRY
ncbi:hypothetical protein DFH08DRAFT_827452 [Mycena albidolilacea]|uniref:Uncharacterized protein n=1 Tax=Mycena albidolilacea TaxID=1033008 RepID=A0AAD6YY57_9AGAR|nr:hypothetical protein DFH08DRAFT_827452 [Mycena albidolilacea]